MLRCFQQAVRRRASQRNRARGSTEAHLNHRLLVRDFPARLLRIVIDVNDGLRRELYKHLVARRRERGRTWKSVASGSRRRAESVDKSLSPERPAALALSMALKLAMTLWAFATPAGLLKNQQQSASGSGNGIRTKTHPEAIAAASSAFILASEVASCTPDAMEPPPPRLDMSGAGPRLISISRSATSTADLAASSTAAAVGFLSPPDSSANMACCARETASRPSASDSRPLPPNPDPAADALPDLTFSANAANGKEVQAKLRK